MGSSGARVEEPSSGFSISIVPPHFEQRVFTLGRSPSFDSSNLYLDWQLGQTTIIATLLHSPGPPWTTGLPARTAGERIIRIRRPRQPG